MLVLLADAARQARTAGLRVLQVTGRESETLTTSLGAIAGGMGTRIGLIPGGCPAAGVTRRRPRSRWTRGSG